MAIFGVLRVILEVQQSKKFRNAKSSPFFRGLRGIFKGKFKRANFKALSFHFKGPSYLPILLLKFELFFNFFLVSLVAAVVIALIHLAAIIIVCRVLKSREFGTSIKVWNTPNYDMYWQIKVENISMFFGIFWIIVIFTPEIRLLSPCV